MWLDAELLWEMKMVEVDGMKVKGLDKLYTRYDRSCKIVENSWGFQVDGRFVTVMGRDDCSSRRDLELELTQTKGSDVRRHVERKSTARRR